MSILSVTSRSFKSKPPYKRRFLRILTPMNACGCMQVEIRVQTQTAAGWQPESSDEYDVVRLPADGVVEVFAVSHAEQLDRNYRCEMHSEQDVTCTCAGFNYRAECKHIDLLRKLRSDGVL